MFLGQLQLLIFFNDFREANFSKAFVNNLPYSYSHENFNFKFIICFNN